MLPELAEAIFLISVMSIVSFSIISLALYVFVCPFVFLFLTSFDFSNIASLFCHAGLVVFSFDGTVSFALTV
jgi:hypothetical protein|tara:strand:- start:215 stop:430 length:216 start_codon:yes stop_codon:yes gene_type:complete